MRLSWRGEGRSALVVRTRQLLRRGSLSFRETPRLRVWGRRGRWAVHTQDDTRARSAALGPALSAATREHRDLPPARDGRAWLAACCWQGVAYPVPWSRSQAEPGLGDSVGFGGAQRTDDGPTSRAVAGGGRMLHCCRPRSRRQRHRGRGPQQRCRSLGRAAQHVESEQPPSRARRGLGPRLQRQAQCAGVDDEQAARQDQRAQRDDMEAHRSQHGRRQAPGVERGAAGQV